jgi:hypothetical protein
MSIRVLDPSKLYIMKKTTSILWIVTMLFISMFIYVSTFDTQTTKEDIDFLKFFIAFFAFVSVFLTIFDNIEVRRTVRFSQRNGFYSILLLSLISFSSCTEMTDAKKEKLDAGQEKSEVTKQLQVKIIGYNNYHYVNNEEELSYYKKGDSLSIYTHQEIEDWNLYTDAKYKNQDKTLYGRFDKKFHYKYRTAVVIGWVER